MHHPLAFRHLPKLVFFFILLRYARFLRICAICFRLIFTFCSQHLSMKNTGCFWQNEKRLRKKRKDGKLSERRYSQWNLISGGYRWNHITNQMEIQTKMWTVWSITFSTHNRFKFFYLTKKNGSNFEYYTCIGIFPWSKAMHSNTFVLISFCRQSIFRNVICVHLSSSP